MTPREWEYFSLRADYVLLRSQRLASRGEPEWLIAAAVLAAANVVLVALCRYYGGVL